MYKSVYCRQIHHQNHTAMIKRVSLVITMAVALMACSQQNEIEILTESFETDNIIVSESQVVTPELAASVALSTRGISSTSRNGSTESISNIKIVRNEKSGNPAFYAVNFADSKGYVLISSSQNYTPVLAKVESGTFDEATIPDNMRYYLEGYKLAIEASNEAPEDSIKVYRMQWEKYLGNNEPIKKYNSRTISPEAQYFIEDSQWKWNRLGYKWTSLAENTLNLDFFEEIVDMVRDSRPDIDLGTCFIIWRDVQFQNIINNLVSSKWAQGSPYNSMIENGCPAGCTPVAMGQLMRYHKKPSTFNWSAMADSYSSGASATDVAYLLKDIGEKSKTTYTATASSTTSSNALNALKGYGYSNAKQISHNLNTIYTEIEKKRPVIGFGQEKTTLTGHTWLYTGFDYTYVTYRYFLYVLSGNSASTYTWDETELSTNYLDPREFFDYTINLCYINWGWGGYGDGWYYSPNFTVDNKSYTVNRLEFVNLY